MTWIQEHVHFDEAAPEASCWITSTKPSTCLHAFCVCEKAITEAILKAPLEVHAVIEALQALRGSADRRHGGR